jgi:hypothetical protein
MVEQQTLTEGEESGAPAVGEESEGADADKAAGQNMEQETAQELLRREGHHSLVISVGIILPAESHLVVLEGDEAVVGDGDAMSVAGEIAENVMGAAERRLGVDDPVLTEQGAEGTEGFLVLQRLERAGESKLVLLKASL